MNKTLKRICILLIVAFLLPILNTKAYNPRDLTDYAKEIDQRQTWDIDGQVEVNKQYIKTVYNGNLVEPIWNNHTVSWVSVGEASPVKAVVWSKGTKDGSNYGWDASTLPEFIEDYEKTHPGYVVVAAVNGDFFDINGTGEPTNYHVQEGDVLRTISPGADYRGLIGFTDDVKQHVVSYNASRSEKMALEILENGKTVKSFDVEGSNVSPTADGVYVYTPSFNGSISVAGKTVYEGTYSMFREGTYTSDDVRYTDGYFVKGVINGLVMVTGGDTITKVPKGKFYIVAPDNILEDGMEVKVEYNLTGDMENVPNVLGFVYKVLEKGSALHANASKSENGGFLTTNHPRTLVGFKEDGSLVLMVVDGRGMPSNNREGATLFQAGELLKVAGCVEGYNLDGGGSSTLMAKINGEWVVMNTPSDGSLRSDGNAILLVMKDPKIEIEGAFGNSITVKRTGEAVDGKVQNIVVSVDSMTYPMEGDSITITDLVPNMEYYVGYSYEIVNDDGTIIKGTTNKFIVKTEDFKVPTLKEFKEHKKEDGSITFSYKIDDSSRCVKRIFIKNNDKEFEFEDTSGRALIEEINTEIKNDFTLYIELESGDILELGTLTYEAGTIPAKEVDDNPSGPVDGNDQSSGCKEDLALVMTSIISMACVAVLLKKKR